MSPFDRGERIHERMLADVAAWEAKRPPPAPWWVGLAIVAILLVWVGVLVLAGWHVVQWLGGVG
jgi:hypothetical protein